MSVSVDWRHQPRLASSRSWVCGSAAVCGLPAVPVSAMSVICTPLVLAALAERPGRRVFPGHPAEQRALDTCRVLRHPFERDRVTEHILVGLDLTAGLHEPQEFVADGHGLPDGLAGDHVRHDGDACLADGAAERFVRYVREHWLAVTVLQRHPECHLVAAGGVDVLHLGVEGLPQARMQRAAVVLQDELLVHRLELHHPVPKNFCACLIPSARASTSSWVLYT